MNCPSCRTANPPEAKFCGACGTRLTIVCAKCGTELPPTAKFCFECGHPVDTESVNDGGPVPAKPERRRATADKVRASRSAGEGERKLVTVLFADIKGSTEMIADQDPEQAVQMIEPIIERMTDAVHRYDGTVTQVMGDGILALFGAPLAHEDHAIRACYAALAMQEAMQGYCEEAGSGEDAAVQIRVGIDSGEVVVRSIDGDLSVDYMAMGQTVHVAARMEQLAAPGSILLTGSTLKLAEGLIQVAPGGRRKIRGLAEPVDVYEVVGLGTVRSRLEAAAARGLTRFVGRVAELGVLQKAQDKALAGHGQVVALVGEPGVGKSRLYWEFIHSERIQGWLLLESSSASYGTVTPFLPVIDLLKAYFRIELRDEAERVREKVTAAMLALDRALEPDIAAVLALLDIPLDDPAWLALDPPQRRRRTLEALVHILLRESQVQPVCLAVEDLHWIDGETQEFLNAVVDCLPTARILLLVDYRPEYEHPWGSKTYYSQLRIAPLTPENSESLLRTILGNTDNLQPLKEQLIAQTQGNPFFLEECVRTLVESEALVGTRGAYQLREPLERIEVPATVQGVLAARIDRLPFEEKRLLQAAAVIGQDVPLALLKAITDEPEETLLERLARLRAAEFLYLANIFPELEYTFKHGQTYQVAYGSLLQDRRRRFHARILEALERLYPDRIIENIEQLGHHAFHGGVWETAVTYLWRAGLKVASRSAHAEAVKAFEQAVLALPHLPETQKNMERAIDLRCDLRNSLWATGQFQRILTYLEDAERLAETLDDARRRAWVSVYVSASLWQVGRTMEARARAEGAKSIAASLGDRPLAVAADFYLGCPNVTSDGLREAEALFEGIAEALTGDLVRERCGLPFLPSVVARSWLVWSYAERGEFARAVAIGKEAARIAETSGQPFSRAHIYYDLGYMYAVKGDLADAVEAQRSALALVRKWNLVYLSPFIMGFLGHALVLAGRVDEGTGQLAQAMETYDSIGLGLFRSLVGVQYGEALMRTGRLEEARATTERALALARERCERSHEAHGLRVLGEIAAHPDLDEAEAAARYFQDARSLAEGLGMRPLVAHCHLGLGYLRRGLDGALSAEDHISTASKLFREMDMRLWLERATDVARAPS